MRLLNCCRTSILGITDKGEGKSKMALKENTMLSSKASEVKPLEC